MNTIGIVYIAYSRLDKIQKTFTALLACEDIDLCDIHVFSDAAFQQKDEPIINNVRKYLRNVAQNNSITHIEIHERETNYGSFLNISEGMKWVAGRYERVFLVEEDVLVNPQFIRYSRNVLDLQKAKNVIAVSAYNPVKDLKMRNDLFYSERFCCYGLAMWSKDILNLCWDVDKLELNRIDTKKFKRIAKDISVCLEDDKKGRRFFQTSWDVIIFYNMLISGQVEILPRVSLCTNIGFDGSGEWSTANSFKNDNYQENYGHQMDYENIEKLSNQEEVKFYAGFIQDNIKKKFLRMGRRAASAMHLEKYAKSIKKVFK